MNSTITVDLTVNQKDILKLLYKGYSVQEIDDELKMGGTASDELIQIKQILGIDSYEDLMSYARSL